MSIIDLEIDRDSLKSHLNAYEMRHLENLARLHYSSIRGTAMEWSAAADIACAVNVIERLCSALGKEVKS